MLDQLKATDERLKSRNKALDSLKGLLKKFAKVYPPRSALQPVHAHTSVTSV